MDISSKQIIIPFIFILLFALIHCISQIILKKTGLARGSIIYDDMTRRNSSGALYSKRYRLAGKPDMILQDGSAYIPVEVKQTVAETPFVTHRAQLLAYCLLLEETNGQKVPYGILRYHNKEFKIPYTQNEKTMIINLINKMREELRSGECHRSTDNRNYCNACGYKEICNERLM